MENTIIFIPRNTEVVFPEEDVGGIIPTGFKKENTELKSPEIGFRKVSLIKNDDNSLEIIRIAKRPTYDLVLPDNRMGAITYVDYHKIIEPIHINKYDGSFMMRHKISIADQLTDLGNLIRGIGTNKTIDVYSVSGDTITQLESIKTPSVTNPTRMINIGIANVFSKKALLQLATEANPDKEFIDSVEEICVTNIAPGESSERWMRVFKNALQAEIQTTDLDTEEIPGITKT